MLGYQEPTVVVLFQIIRTDANCASLFAKGMILDVNDTLVYDHVEDNPIPLHATQIRIVLETHHSLIVLSQSTGSVKTRLYI